MNTSDKLHLGCGTKYIQGYINADINKDLRADIYFDMDKDKWPFEDNQFIEILLWHSLEHSNNYLYVIEELWRVSKNDALIYIGVPYYTSGKYNLVNPYHKINFNEFSFDFFDDNKLARSANENTKARFQKENIKFNYFPEWELKSPTVKEFARTHFFNVVSDIEIKLRVIK